MAEFCGKMTTVHGGNTMQLTVKPAEFLWEIFRDGTHWENVRVVRVG
jgi:hypothetical protein